jgi:transglutaminase-like putative cysteine protease
VSPPTSMDKKRPQLNLDELHRLRWLLGGVLSLFSVWTVFYLDVDAWTLLILNTAGILAVLVWPRLPAFIPGWMHKAAFPVIVIVFLIDLLTTIRGQVLPPMIRLDLMLIFYRATSYRQRRDDLQLIVLGLFLVVVAGVITVSLAFAVQIIAFTACALLLMFVITLADAAEAQDPPVRTPFFTWRIATDTPPWTKHGGWGPLLARLRAASDWRVAVLGTALFAGVVVVSGLLFLAIPRFQFENSLFLDRFISKKAKTGFTDNIKFGDVTDIISDTSLALSVDISDLSKIPVPLYLRMVVLDEYRDGTFKLSPQLRREAFGGERNRVELVGTERYKLNQSTWNFYFEAGVSRYLPLPGSFWRLRLNEPQNVSVSPQLRAVALGNEPITMVAYQLQGVNTSPLLADPEFARTQAAVGGGSGPLKSPVWAALLELPANEKDRAKLRQEVAEVLAPPPSATGGRESVGLGRLTAEEFAQRARVWLDKRHAYSLQSVLPPGTGDPLVRWIDSDVPGHCELFAGALIVLARSAGYPARLVSGFKASNWNGISKSLTVRNSDAHAWCEVWDGSGAWLRVDPTPGAVAAGSADEASGEAAIAEHTDRSWRARLDSLRVFWYRRIVSFDQRNQIDTLRALKTATEETGARLRAALDRRIERVKQWLQSPWNVTRIMTVLTTAAALALAGWAGRWLWRSWRRRPGGRGTGRPDPVRAEAGRWLRRLQTRRGKTAVVAELERLRYGARPTWPEPEAVFRRARQAWREAQRSGVLR